MHELPWRQQREQLRSPESQRVCVQQHELLPVPPVGPHLNRGSRRRKRPGGRNRQRTKIAVLERRITIWSPMGNFLRRQVERQRVSARNDGSSKTSCDRSALVVLCRGTEQHWPHLGAQGDHVTAGVGLTD